MGLMKALIINTDAAVPVPIPVMFNPPEYQLQKTNQYAEIGIPGLGSSLLQFVRGSAQTLTMELFFDTTDLGLDVRAFTGLVLALTDVNSDTHAPPRLLFVWGSLVFPCVLESVSQRFEYFNSLGMPLRARLNVTLKGNDKLEDLLSSIPLLSADRAKRRVVASGDTLQSLAAQEYGDPRQWRAIAEANGIDSPLALTPGQGLIIPTLT
ncbi:LysM peptidoglycan-binding domain-containing protein [Geobacter sp.]|uniref:CIS tube protein n=1 Tax=Geobacter sp. TaxID=46610 RepID=UPI002610180C|nr:LysM peptidoglycan-binding domain-containing protein [Geobacter sp.]